MKKLTALLLGTVISIAFTADAFAENLAMKYLKSNDGNTGLYLHLSGHRGSIDDVNADYTRSVDGVENATSTWQLDDGYGAQLAFGVDFGKIRFDARVGALRADLLSIDTAALDTSTTRLGVLGYVTANVDLDIYRFVLMGDDDDIFPVIAITPYVGYGWGHGGAWLSGKKSGEIANDNTKRDAGGHGRVYTYEGGVLINLTSFAGVTLAYKYLNVRVDDEDVANNLGEVGLRFTF